MTISKIWNLVVSLPHNKYNSTRAENVTLLLPFATKKSTLFVCPHISSWAPLDSLLHRFDENSSRSVAVFLPSSFVELSFTVGNVTR